jgi:hypothetical protein
MLAAMLADLLWGLFLVAGIEHVQFKPGRGAANYIADLDVAISHSLLMDVIWAALFAGAYFMKRHYAQGAHVVFVVVLSHWLLDVVSLAEPLAPGLVRARWVWTMVFRACNRPRRRRFLAARHHSLRACHASSEARRNLRVLGCGRTAHVGMVQQHHRASAFPGP